VVLTELEERCVGLISGNRPSSVKEFLIGSHSPPIWSPSPVLQLVSELVWSLVGFNRLCDPKATWKNVQYSLWSSIVRILVIGRTELATIFRARVVLFGRSYRRHK
jgi:hypothetical protein